MLNSKMVKPAAVVVVALVVFLLPLLVGSGYWLHVLIYIFVMSILTVSLRLIFTTGHASFAHAAFMGLGGYTTALLVLYCGFSYWLVLPLSILVPAVVAFLLGIPILRTGGAYFFLATFAFGMVVVLTIRSYWVAILGGADGLVGIPSPNPVDVAGLLTVTFVGKVPFYYLALLMVLFTVVVMYGLERSRVGMVFKAVRDSEVLARSAGIDTMKYNLLAFTIGSAFAGLAGSFMAHYLHAFSQADFGLDVSVSLLVYLLVGGAGTIVGPIVGTTALVVLSQILHFAKALEVLIYGVAMIVFILLLPEGLVGLPGRVLDAVRSSRVGKWK